MLKNRKVVKTAKRDESSCKTYKHKELLMKFSDTLNKNFKNCLLKQPYCAQQHGNIFEQLANNNKKTQVYEEFLEEIKSIVFYFLLQVLINILIDFKS